MSLSLVEHKLLKCQICQVGLSSDSLITILKRCLFAESEIQDHVIGQLAECFGPWIYQYTHVTVKNWADHQWIEGSPGAYQHPGTLSHWPLLRQAHDRVHFGGTETATQWIGTVQYFVHCKHDCSQSCDPPSKYLKDVIFEQSLRIYGGSITEWCQSWSRGAQHHQASVTLSSRTQGTIIWSRLSDFAGNYCFSFHYTVIFSSKPYLISV